MTAAPDLRIVVESPPFGVDLTESHAVLPDEFKNAVLHRVGRLDWARYPARQQQAVLERIAAHYLVSPQELILTRGASEGLRTSFQLLKNHSRSVLLPVPGFFGFRDIATSLQLSTQDFDASNGFAGLAKHLERGTRDHVPVLCSPNNPTGHVIDLGTLARVCELGPAPISAVVDLTYDAFTDHPLQHHLRRLVDRGAVSCLTASKTFALAGARAGLLIGPAATIRSLTRIQDRFPLDYFQLAVIDTLFAPEWSNLRAEIVDSTKTLRDSVVRLLHRVFPKDHVLPANANFVCVRYDAGLPENFVREVVGSAACKWFADERLLRFTVNPRTATGLSDITARLAL
ncbi:Histidinol-phosphate/aromatic aminotransferase or cobyric acid decarboxylase [Lentzea albidocapillata subsp. violacea]|uniref:Histidinol-phosphate/aromatic aminotransferase or cobyric acid decarboxylase n=1 Tax=Lentzea albidocapillata subsp. violacea TaxID=128104 RepID=A0A1G9Q3W1_9PSEU|nr:aminotransferase class I/II-fold pyridoxal phosphate-dependent enzyme [Lentzea albidocapillata]SDM05732.1 Histidinol-phosphate/aromatic aminotransferase or cobyric acid decarboxylase [Lentzea albidocapillata subsp. violacea]